MIRVAAIVAASALTVTALAAAAPPRAGVLVPGRSLGGLRLGMSTAQVERLWGTSFGLCRGCPDTTWYFNYRPFTPKGAGVSFRRGRVVAVFTLWSPRGWRTTRGLRLGDDDSQVAALYPVLPPLACGRYSAQTLRSPRAATDFYVLDGRVWGFGLRRPGIPACR